MTKLLKYLNIYKEPILGIFRCVSYSSLYLFLGFYLQCSGCLHILLITFSSVLNVTKQLSKDNISQKDKSKSMENENQDNIAYRTLVK